MKMAAPCDILFEQLADYAEGRSAPTDAQRLGVHLDSGCPACHERLAFVTAGAAALNEALADAAALEAELPSRAVRDYVRGLGRLPTPAAPVVSLPVRAPLRWVARLVLDAAGGGMGGMSLSGARSSEPAEPVQKQRLYETEEHLVTLWEERSDANAGSYVIGQVYRREDGLCLTPESVLFTTGSGATREARQEEGEFHAPDLAPDVYLIQCWLEDGVVVVSDVGIGVPAS